MKHSFRLLIVRCVCTVLLLAVPLPTLATDGLKADTLAQAVIAYRQGHYTRACELLSSQDWYRQPRAEQPRWLYYQAISEVQAGQPDAAGSHYTDLIQTFPGTVESQLAEQGLMQLGALGETRLDAPPGPAGVTGNAGVAATTPQSAEQLQFNQLMGMMGGSGQNQSSNQTPSLESMLMNPLLGQSGLSQSGWGQQGFGQQGHGFNGNAASTLDPAALSTMMMNQWIGQMDIMGTQSDRNRD